MSSMTTSFSQTPFGESLLKTALSVSCVWTKAFMNMSTPAPEASLENTDLRLFAFGLRNLALRFSSLTLYLLLWAFPSYSSFRRMSLRTRRMTPLLSSVRNPLRTIGYPLNLDAP